MAKKKVMKKKAQVFAVPKDESGSGKHEVIVAPGGDLNKGKVKTSKKWSDSVGFAHKKGVELGAEVTVHEYDTNPNYAVNYRLPRRKAPRITPKRPKLSR